MHLGHGWKLFSPPIEIRNPLAKINECILASPPNSRARGFEENHQVASDAQENCDR